MIERLLHWLLNVPGSFQKYIKRPRLAYQLRCRGYWIESTLSLTGLQGALQYHGDSVRVHHDRDYNHSRALLLSNFQRWTHRPKCYFGYVNPHHSSVVLLGLLECGDQAENLRLNASLEPSAESTELVALSHGIGIPHDRPRTSLRHGENE